MSSSSAPVSGSTEHNAFIRQHVPGLWRFFCAVGNSPGAAEEKMTGCFRGPALATDTATLAADLYRRAWSMARGETGQLVICLNRLSPDQCLALLLQEYAGLTPAEIGVALRLPVKDVKIQLAAARENLKRALLD